MNVTFDILMGTPFVWAQETKMMMTTEHCLFCPMPFVLFGGAARVEFERWVFHRERAAGRDGPSLHARSWECSWSRDQSGPAHQLHFGPAREYAPLTVAARSCRRQKSRDDRRFHTTSPGWQ